MRACFTGFCDDFGQRRRSPNAAYEHHDHDKTRIRTSNEAADRRERIIDVPITKTRTDHLEDTRTGKNQPRLASASQAR